MDNLIKKQEKHTQHINFLLKQYYKLSKNVVKILDTKCKKGTGKNHSWVGFENGCGEECGVDIENLIKEAKKINTLTTKNNVSYDTKKKTGRKSI